MADVYEDLVSGNAVVLPVLDTELISYTGSVTGGGSKVFTSTILKYRQRLNGYEISFTVNGNTTASGGGATALQIPIPSGAVIDLALLPDPSSITSDANEIGSGYEFGIGALGAYTPLAAITPRSTTTIGFYRSGGALITTAQINNTNAVVLSGVIWVPIVGLSAYRAYGAGVSPTSPSLVKGGYEEGTFNGTLTGGVTTNPVGVFSYKRTGKQVTIRLLANLLATSNATTRPIITGLPASITPSSSTGPIVPCAGVVDSGTSIVGIGYANILPNNTIAIAQQANMGGSFVASGNKGLNDGFCITYSLD